MRARQLTAKIFGWQGLRSTVKSSDDDYAFLADLRVVARAAEFANATWLAMLLPEDDWRRHLQASRAGIGGAVLADGKGSMVYTLHFVRYRHVPLKRGLMVGSPLNSGHAQRN